MHWAILYDGGALTREDLALSDLGDFEYSLFIVYNETTAVFIYEPCNKRAVIFTDDGPREIGIEGRPFFHSLVRATYSTTGEYSESRTLEFGIKDQLTFTEREGCLDVVRYEHLR